MISKFFSVVLFSVLVTCSYANGGSIVEIYMGCGNSQNVGIKKLEVSNYYFEKSGASEICVSEEYFIDHDNFELIRNLKNTSDELEEEFSKAFEAIDNLIDIPGEIVEEDGQSVSIRLSQEGRKVLNKMTRNSDTIYIVVDGLVITNVSIYEPIETGEFDLIGVDASVYKELKKVM